jgi:AAA+ ATPase superfamily predicted ATPase
MIRFINRKPELKMFNDAWSHDEAGMIILYGRRRIGKSRLILEFAKGKKGIYYTAEDVTGHRQLIELKHAFADYLADDFLKGIDIKEWSQLFDYLKKVLPRDRKLYIIIDEFSYIVRNSPVITSSLQRFWDEFLSKTKVLLILSGSLLGIMTEEVLASSSPLYGRRTRDLLLGPLLTKDAIKFLNGEFKDRLAIYFAIGGVPEYLLKASHYRSALEFFASEFLHKDGYFFREPTFLLSREFREVKTYFSILNALAYGHTKPSEIANFVGIKAREIYPYVENLRTLGFIDKELVLFGKRREAHYHIKDPLFDFWFNFVYDNKENIEKGIYLVDRKNLNAYLGRRFEMWVRDNFHLFFEYDKIGRWRGSAGEIDVVAVSEKKDTIVFGECKWKENVSLKKLVGELKEKNENIEWHRKSREEYFVIFAKSFVEKTMDKHVMAFDLANIASILH